MRGTVALQWAKLALTAAIVRPPQNNALIQHARALPDMRIIIPTARVQSVLPASTKLRKGQSHARTVRRENTLLQQVPQN